MKGVMRASVSAGASQREASVTWSPQVIVPSGAAWAARGAAHATPARSRPIVRMPRRARVPPVMAPSSPGVEPQFLVGGRVRVIGGEAEARFRHPGPVAVEEGGLHDRQEHRLVVHELLDLL